jgi:predicted RNase H-like HicB family nuclease
MRRRPFNRAWELARRVQHHGGYLTYFPALEGCNVSGKTYEAAVVRAEEGLGALPRMVDELDEIIGGVIRE